MQSRHSWPASWDVGCIDAPAGSTNSECEPVQSRETLQDVAPLMLSPTKGVRKSRSQPQLCPGTGPVLQRLQDSFRKAGPLLQSSRSPPASGVPSQQGERAEMIARSHAELELSQGRSAASSNFPAVPMTTSTKEKTNFHETSFGKIGPLLPLSSPSLQVFIEAVSTSSAATGTV